MDIVGSSLNVSELSRQENLKQVLDHPPSDEELAALKQLSTPKERLLYIMQHLVPERARVSVTPSEAYTRDFNLERFPLTEEQRQVVKNMLDVIRRNVSYPLILDNFGDDKKGRDRWKDTMYTVFGSLYVAVNNANKAATSFLTAMGSADIIAEEMRETNSQDATWEGRKRIIIDRAEALVNLAISSSDPDADNDAKREIADKIDRAARQFLDLFT